MNKLQFEQENSVDPGLELELIDDILEITITDDWTGDSETGFGRILSVCLDSKQRHKLIMFLQSGDDNE